MIELLTRAFFICFIMEIGSASNFTIAALANNSSKWLVALIGGLTGVFFADLLAIKFLSYVNRLPINSNVVSGLTMIILGLFFILKKET